MHRASKTEQTTTKATRSGLSVFTRRRFKKAVKQHYLTRIAGEPTEHQLSLIDDIAFYGWAEREADLADNKVVANREAARHRRLRHFAQKDFEKTLPELVDRAGQPAPVSTLSAYLKAKYQ